MTGFDTCNTLRRGVFPYITSTLIGTLGVEPRLSPYKEPALTIKLCPQEVMKRRYARCIFVKNLRLLVSSLPHSSHLIFLLILHFRLFRSFDPSFLASAPPCKFPSLSIFIILYQTFSQSARSAYSI